MWKIATLVWIVLGTTLAGSALMVVVSIPSLYDQGMRLIPYAVAAGFVVAVPLSVWIASKMMDLTRPGPQSASRTSIG